MGCLCTKTQSPDQFEAEKQRPPALCCLYESHPLRKLCIYIARSRPFEIFIYLAIFANCVSLAMYKPMPKSDVDETSSVLDTLEYIFIGIFWVESIVKIIAQGFMCHHGSYLRSFWNVLDFFIVIVGTLSVMSLDTGGIKALRALRVLRPLKFIAGCRPLQVVMNSILMALIPLMNVAVLILFFIIFCAIMGMELFRGQFNQACADMHTEEIPDNYKHPCDETLQMGFMCPQSYNCVDWEGPNEGITTFNHIGLASLTVFQIITLEGWTDIMYWSMDAIGPELPPLFYCNIVIWGAFFMLNLVLGVLAGEFSKQREKIEARKEYLRKKRNDDYKKELEGYELWIREGEKISENEAMKEQRRLGGKNSYDGNHLEDNFDDVSNISERQRNGLSRCWQNLFPSLRERNRLLRERAAKIVKSKSMYWVVMFLVTMNTISVSLKWYGMPEEMDKNMKHVEFVFTFIFIIEMTIRMYGLGIEQYFKSKFNTFDFTVIFASLFEQFYVQFFDGADMGLTVFRSLRLLRLFKVTRYWTSLRNLAAALLNSLKSIVSLLFLLFLFLLIFALLGMQLFGGHFVFAEQVPRVNFDSFLTALLAVFQMLTGEDWNVIMYNAINALGGSNNYKGGICSIYFIVFMVIMNYTLLNVFLAIAVDGLADFEMMNDAEKEDEKKEEAEKDAVMQELHNLDNVSDGDDVSNTRPASIELRNRAQAYRADYPDHADTPISIEDSDMSDEENLPEHDPDNWIGPRSARSWHSDGSRSRRTPRPQTTTVPIVPHRSFFIFSPTNPLRRFCHWIVNLRHFDNFILFIILLSCIMQMLQNPKDLESDNNRFIEYLEYGVTVIFCLEMILRVIDLGFVIHPGSYLRDPWNVLDAVVVLVSILRVAVKAPTVKRLTNVMLSMRSLKSINRIQKLKNVCLCLVKSVGSILNLLLIAILLTFMFSVMGVHMLEGKFFFCTDSSKKTAPECMGSYFAFPSNDAENRKVEERKWQKHFFRFDDVQLAMLTLFTVATFEGWPDVMTNMMDASLKDHGPIENANPALCIYIVVYLVVMSFFMINIFVGFVIVTFQEKGEKDNETSILDRNKRSCIEFSLKVKPQNKYIPNNEEGLRYKLWQVVSSSIYTNLIMFIIFINTIQLMMPYHGMSRDYETGLETVNAILVAVFTVDIILKLAAYGVKQYFLGGSWNIFDFVVLVGSFIDIMVSTWYTDNFMISRLVKMFRAARLIKLLNYGGEMRTLLFVFLKALKSLPHVMFLVMLTFYIYAIIGMQIFGKVIADPDNNPDYVITRYNNFESFENAMILLFRCSTGEAWHAIMRDLTPERAICSDVSSGNKDTNCGSSFSLIYFCTFVITSQFLVVNLFVSVIIDNFDYLTRDMSIVGLHHLNKFVRKWADFDPKASGRIKHEDVIKLLKRISPPLGLGKKCPDRVAYMRMIGMNMPLLQDGTVEFTATLFALVRTSLDIHMPKGVNAVSDMNKQLKGEICRTFPGMRSKLLERVLPVDEPGKEVETVAKIYATLMIQKFYRHLQKKREEEFQKSQQQPLVAGLRIPHELSKPLKRQISGELDLESDDDEYNNISKKPVHSIVSNLFNSVKHKRTDNYNNRSSGSTPRLPHRTSSKDIELGELNNNNSPNLLTVLSTSPSGDI
ncbi:hypothetical protein ACHWQZ_G003966 [Mnemiopsis leidyi]|uniref:Calcium-channel protein CCH1 n=1 Tax=Mnemiopsis leidyi TaxID=27923 RepID=A0A8K1YCC4_MNELE|nr:CaV2 voltage-gated calcium channel alpha-1 subunit [Mnemiopsis leidyi]